MILTGSEVYAWQCHYTPTDEGYITEGSLQCEGIDPLVALEDFWCVSYQPDDPVCEQFAEKICVDTYEYRTESCPIHYSGGLQFSRTYFCSTQTWTDWTLVSNLCSPDPPSCVTSSISRNLACGEGYTGQIIEIGNYLCPDPYGQPVFSGWMEQSKSCVPSVTTVQADPTTATNPVVKALQANPTATSTAPAANPILNIQMEESKPVDDPVNSTLDDSNNETASSVNTSSNVKENPDNGKTEKTEKKKDESIQFTVSPSYGIVLSPDILTQPFSIISPIDIKDAFSMEQDFNDQFKRTEANLVDFIKQNDSEDYYTNHSNNLGQRLWSNQFLYQNE